MISAEDLKQEIEQLDVNCLEQVYRLLQQFPHKQNIKSKINLLDYSRPIQYAGNVVNGDLAYTDIEDAAQYGKQLRSSEWNRRSNHD
jgi:hypothetical protein